MLNKKATGKSGKRKITDRDRKMAKVCVAVQSVNMPVKNSRVPHSGLSKRLREAFVPSARPLNEFMAERLTSR